MEENSLLLKQMELGPMENYIYFLGDIDTKEIAIVDPAWEVDTIIREIKNEGLVPKSIFITHGHPDHTNGINDLLKAYDIPVYVSKYEAEFYKPINDNIKEVDPGDQINLGKINVTFLHTPGHTPGSQCFLADGRLIAGDTLFLDGCGRCDLPGGDAETMYETIDKKLMRLPDETIIYPGHNYHEKTCDTLLEQKKTNPYMQCGSLKEFLAERMGI